MMQPRSPGRRRSAAFRSGERLASRSWGIDSLALVATQRIRQRSAGNIPTRPAASFRFVAALALLLSPAALLAFNGHVVTEGPLTITLGEVPVVRAFDEPQACAVTLANAGPAPLAVALAMTLVDDCHAVGAVRQTVNVPAHGSVLATPFQFACGPRTYSAHYPVHVEATFTIYGARRTAHAVQIFQTDFSAATAQAPPGEWAVTRVPAGGAFSLVNLKSQRVAWSYLGEPLVRLPVGWTGADAASAATFSRAPMTRGGETRPALQMHPPYRPRAGTVFAEYRLRLPAATPIRLEFFNAIRDSSPREGQSDGVTFRVWVADEKRFERHTDSKTWVRGSADLSAFAGQEVLLRLESHPGPQNNTVCDASFWGDPVITVGTPPKMLSPDERATLSARAAQILASGRPADDRSLAYELAGGGRAAVVLGPNGIADGVIGFGDGQRQVRFGGLHIAVRDQVVGAWPSGAVVQGVSVTRDSAGRTRIVHRLKVNDLSTELVATLWRDGPGLRIKVECPERITALALNAADQRAARVYYGHGYCIVDPQPFRANAGGHNLATSHVGFDFERGVSLLTATDTPPDYLQVDPEKHLYQLHTHPDATLTFVPGFSGAFDCAIRYRPLYDKQAAPGVAKKASRFVFDLWGGAYADNTAKLARCFDYGLTDALVMIHVWQRWGYDYRLPDIFPPQPSLGPLEDLQQLGRACTERGVLWGLHDNYIDIYPDADGFSYDHVTFSEDGKPRRAWLNEGREAQSYQFRPDHLRPFLDRNLKLIVPALHPTSSFVDVFSSINTFDFFDRDGRFHSKTETQRAWGEAFAAIRDAGGNNAPTVSEAGSDHLIGWLDGADAQFILLDNKPAPFHNVVTCREWERVPWFDVVNHTRFSLHGAGYSDRYQGGRSREEHGIESDDYLGAELLTGHALMIDRTALARGAVRKYWLAQDFIRSIARDEITAVEFAGGDLHRLIISWNSGARVCVNRGEIDWPIDGHVLPPHGYWARHGDIESSIERFGPAIAEQSRSRGKFYANSRGFSPAAPLAITPTAERVEHLGGRQFRLFVNWEAQRAAPKDYAVFYHFSRPTPGRRALTEFFGGGQPALPTSQWQGRLTTGEDWTITLPPEMPLGEYEILVGLHDPRNRNARERLLGDEDARRRYRVGKLVIEGDRAGTVTGVRFVPPPQPYVPSSRWLANQGAVDFGVVETTGAFRCELRPDQLIVTPLPDGPDSELTLHLERLLGRRAEVKSVETIDARGNSISAATFTIDRSALALHVTAGVFAYRINVK